MKWAVQNLLVALFLIAQTTFALADEPAPRPAAATDSGDKETVAARPSAAELVEGVVADDAKFASLKSLFLRFEGKWTRPVASITRSIERMKKDRPGDQVDLERDTGLLPEITEELELAFDRKRLRKFEHWHKASWRLRVFDGETGVSHEKDFHRGQEHYALVSRPEAHFANELLDLSVQRVGPARFWFQKDGMTPEERQQRIGLPKDFQRIADADYHGQVCFVVENRQTLYRLFIGKEDRRLRGVMEMVLPNDVPVLTSINQVTGKNFATMEEASKWAESLSKAELIDFQAKEREWLFSFARSFAEHWLDDYREIAPGVWFAATQGYRIHDARLPDAPEDFSRVLRLVDSKANEPLDDKLFKIALTDGVLVYDSRFDVPISYAQKASRKLEEFEKLVDQKKAGDQSWQRDEQERNKQIGQPAPDLPDGVWLNSSPLTLASLKGKVVILDFWSSTYPPCRGDLSIVEALHRASDRSSVVVIGIHADGADREDVAKFAKDHKLTFPIVIDKARPKPETVYGHLFDQMRVRSMRHAVVIDRAGNVAAQGDLREMQFTAAALANESKE